MSRPRAKPCDGTYEKQAHPHFGVQKRFRPRVAQVLT